VRWDRFDEYLGGAVVFAVDNVLFINSVFASLILSSIAIVRVIGDATSRNYESDSI
jgi:hypothetical protein